MLTERERERAASLRKQHRCWRHLTDEQTILAAGIYAMVRAKFKLDETKGKRRSSRKKTNA